uniref:ABC-2 type transporter transmembrane domain-containing protein n=1 Tax=Chromera velia CCMP2878 TaxID=1169474 RepID=A0A0G4FTC4_9ALVE|eukprot:Cvel_18623.t1-p1 / transcript=Cvel_18623.t1 / gene=Cvel_18623 / organism=Chromera_velia_CCMP2878 / gene_product=ABC transporter G family member 7, putative / transcript_product=ABC transporter G family member 7, putative / location=Cvel_scaffold1555:409-6507(+) / protein_length=853 / sequence_SO=supercontig / SO=protein_coding / is_pseudo=false
MSLGHSLIAHACTPQNGKNSRWDAFLGLLHFLQVFGNLSLVAPHAVEQRIAILVQSLICNGMIALVKSLTFFSREQEVVRRERQSRLYGALPYLLGKALVETPVDAAFPFIFGWTLHKLCGLKTEGGARLRFVGTLIVHSLASAVLGMALSSALPSPEVALAVGPALFVVFILLGGFLENEELPLWLRPVKMVSTVNWTYRALATNEFRGQVFTQEEVRPPGFAGKFISVRPPDLTGEQVLERLGLTGETVSRPLRRQGLLMTVELLLCLVGLSFRGQRSAMLRPPTADQGGDGNPGDSQLPLQEGKEQNPVDKSKLSKVTWALSIGVDYLRGRRAGEEDESVVSITQEAAKTLYKNLQQFLGSPGPDPVSEQQGRGLKGFAVANRVKFVNVTVYPTKPIRISQLSEKLYRKKIALYFVIGLDCKDVAPFGSDSHTAVSSLKSGDVQPQRPVKAVYKFFCQALSNLLSNNPDTPSLNLSVNKDKYGKTKLQLVLFQPSDTASRDDNFRPDDETHARLLQSLWAENLKKDGGSLAHLSFEFCMNDVEGSLEKRVADFMKKVRTVLSKPPSVVNMSTLPTPPGSDPNNSSNITFILDPDSLCRIACCGREVREGSEAAGIVETVSLWSTVMVFGGAMEQYGRRRGKNVKGAAAAAAAARPVDASNTLPTSLPASRRAATALPFAVPLALPPAGLSQTAGAAAAASSSVFRNPGTALFLGSGAFISITTSMDCEKEKDKEKGKEDAERGGDKGSWDEGPASGGGQSAGCEGRLPDKRSRPVEEPSQTTGDGVGEVEEEKKEEEEDDAVSEEGKGESTEIGVPKRRRHSTNDPEEGGGERARGGADQEGVQQEGGME